GGSLALSSVALAAGELLQDLIPYLMEPGDDTGEGEGGAPEAPNAIARARVRARRGRDHTLQCAENPPPETDSLKGD
ncbi:unnamed protein product, partial [Discosporangium mesarthrocarpum]